MNRTLKIATRKSQLALWQANWVKGELEKRNPGLRVDLVRIVTKGDKILDVPLAKVGGKGLFVKEIEDALLDGRADLAVHSMKDVPTELPPGLHLGAVCEREDPRDAWFSRGGVTLRDLPAEEGQYDAIVLAAAGVKRLGFADRVTEYLATDVTLPAIGQGAVGIECRVDDGDTNALVAPLKHPATWTAVLAERAFLATLQGGCQVPIAAYAELEGGEVALRGLVGSLDGQTMVRGSRRGSPVDAESLGIDLAEELLDRGAREILEEVYRLEALSPQET